MSIHLKTYAAVTVGTSATDVFTGQEDGVTTLYFSAPSGNAASIFIGDSNVNSTTARGVLEIIPGAINIALKSDHGMGGGSQFLDLTSIRAISGSAAQTLRVSALKATT